MAYTWGGGGSIRKLLVDIDIVGNPTLHGTYHMHMGNAANTAYTMATDINTYNINNEMHQSDHNTLSVMTRVVAAMDHGAKREAGPCTYHAHTLNQH